MDVSFVGVHRLFRISVHFYFIDDYFVVVVHQDYVVDVFRETIIRGNDALMKCDIPSYVSDFVRVLSWIDSEGNDIQTNLDSNVFGNFLRVNRLVDILDYKA